MKSRGRLRTCHVRYVSAYLPGGISANTALTAVAIGLWSDALIAGPPTIPRAREREEVKHRVGSKALLGLRVHSVVALKHLSTGPE